MALPQANNTLPLVIDKRAVFYDRAVQPERQIFDEVSPGDIVARLLDGHPTRHLVAGELGSGKSWFAGETSRAARAAGVHVIEVGCVEFEADVAFLPLALVLSQSGMATTDHPTLDAVLGRGGPPPTALALGAAVAEVLHEQGAKTPLLVIVDDAHWADSDSLQALLFAARRLDVASVGFVFTAVPGANPRVDACGLDPVRLGRWDDERVVDHLVASGWAPAPARAAVPLTAGIALAVHLLLETANEQQRLGLVPLPPAIAVPEPVARRTGTDFERLDPDELLALAITAALPRADVGLLVDVLDRCDVPAAARVAIGALGIVTIEPVVQWESPIVRSAALRLIDNTMLTQVHRHVADAATAADLPDLALRHRAAAGIGTDDTLAEQLEQAAYAANERGALLTAAEALRQSALASSNTDDAARRLGAAADRAFGAGNSEQAVPYARAATEIGRDEHWAFATMILGEALLWAEGWAIADRTLCDGARLIGDRFPTEAASMLIHATIQAVVALDAPAACERIERARVAAERSDNELIQLPVPVVGAIAETLGGGARETDQVLANASQLALSALDYRHPIGAAMAELVGFAAITREDTAHGIALLQAANDAGRRDGSVGMAAITSFLLTDALWRSGRWTRAQVEIGHAVDLARDAGFEFLAECGDGFRAWAIAGTGRTDECVRLAEVSLRRTEPLQLRLLSLWAHAAMGLAALTNGECLAAADAYDRVDALWTQGGVHEPNLLWWQADHIEALVGAGRRTAAEAALAKFSADAKRTGRPHALAGVAKSRALLTDDPTTRLIHLDDAVARMRTCEAPFDVARCLLDRGRARIEQGDAAGGDADLHEARGLFDRLGARPWSEQASATREGSQPTPAGLADLLSEAELRVAVVIANGAQNKEAAEQLFVSTKTIEYHLSNIYRKLQLRSRVELARYVSDRM